MADDAKAPGRDLASLLGAIARDAGRLIDQHGALLRQELRDGLGDSAGAVATIGAGAGLVAAGGVLGSLMLVHGLNRATRIPLWGCYGVVGGLMAVAGTVLIGAGTRKVGNLTLTPRRTIATLRDDLRWIIDQTETRTS